MIKTNIFSYERDLVNDKTLNAVIGVLFFILATALGAYVRIPLEGTPVPITLQTLFVILSGAVLGWRLGFYSQLGYLLLGAIGLPIFQGYSSGISHILGPTGGYLVGFLFASSVVGIMTSQKEPNIYLVLASFIIGNIILYSLGVSWLIYIYKIEILKALSMGVIPFIPIELIKISLATLIYSKISRRAKNIFSF
jgi:biotin transport system substrate-specific component